jgi:hypothetical protein
MALVQLPIRTFGEVAAFGYGIQIHCPLCRRRSEVDPLSPDLHDRPFFSTRFRCRGVRHMGSAAPSLPCECLGHIHLVPPAADLVRPNQVIPYCQISCSTCVPYWQIDQARNDREPWASLFSGPAAGIACPACGRKVHTTWYGGAGLPGVE